MNEVSWAGLLLVAGFVLFLTGAAFWKPAVYQQDLEVSLQAMAEDRRRLRWILTWMLLGVSITTLGLSLLAAVIWAEGEKVFSVLGLSLFGLGAVLWLVALVFRITVGEWAASQTLATGKVPEGFPAWDRWAGAIHSYHMLSAYGSWALFGAALLTTGLAPTWLGWAGMISGALLMVGFIFLRGGLLSPPILAHVYPLAVGVALLA